MERHGYQMAHQVCEDKIGHVVVRLKRDFVAHEHRVRTRVTYPCLTERQRFPRLVTMFDVAELVMFMEGQAKGENVWTTGQFAWSSAFA